MRLTLLGADEPDRQHKLLLEAEGTSVSRRPASLTASGGDATGHVAGTPVHPSRARDSRPSGAGRKPLASGRLLRSYGRVEEVRGRVALLLFAVSSMLLVVGGGLWLGGMVDVSEVLWLVGTVMGLRTDKL